MRPLLEGLTLQGFAARRLRIVLEPCSPAHSAAVQSLGEAGLARGASPGPYLKFIACPHFLSKFCFLLCANTNKGASHFCLQLSLLPRVPLRDGLSPPAMNRDRFFLHPVAFWFGFG